MSLLHPGPHRSSPRGLGSSEAQALQRLPWLPREDTFWDTSVGSLLSCCQCPWLPSVARPAGGRLGVAGTGRIAEGASQAGVGAVTSRADGSGTERLCLGTDAGCGAAVGEGPGAELPTRAPGARVLASA